MSKRPKASKNLAKHTETKPIMSPRPQQQPDNQTALRFLDSMVSLAPVSRQQHVSVQGAIAQLSRVLQELERVKLELQQLKKDKDKE